MKPLEIGHLATEKPGTKDAIHVPVASVRAGELLSPGMAVTVQNNWASKAVVGTPTGIVDPFLKKDVQPHETFWLFLQPGSVNDLRHEWDTPEFPNPLESDDYQEFVNDTCRGCYS